MVRLFDTSVAESTGSGPIADHSALIQLDVREGWYVIARSIIDFTIAAVSLILVLPIIIIAAILVRLTSRGHAFYSQTRLGLGGCTFTIYKLRSMYLSCENESGPLWSTKGDPRITFVGRIIRRTHIDELPQL